MLNYLSLNVVSIVVTLLIGVYAYFKLVAFQYWKKMNVPYIEPTFPYGNLEPPHKRTMQVGDKIEEQYKIAKREGWKFFGSYNFTQPTFVLVDLELVKTIMAKDFHNFNDRGSYVNEKDEPIGAHLFALGGVKWKNLRTKFTPTFTSGKMKMMFQTLADCSVLLDRAISDISAKKEPVDIKNVLACFTTDIIGSCGFGLDINSLANPKSPFRIHGMRAFDTTHWENFKVFFATSFPDFSNFLGICTIPRDVSTFFENVVKDTVEYREKNNVTRKDFLQMLIDMKNNQNPDASTGNGTSLNMNELIAQCFLFFLAGFETSSSNMTFVLFELSRNPEIQEKVRKEIYSVLKKHNDKIDYDSLKDLVYMQQVIEEGLRLYSPVTFLTRVCAEDYKIANSDVVLKKDTLVTIPVKAIHYDEEYYHEPEKFHPERFSDEEKQKRHQYAFLPFGEGPRICIGLRFAIMVIKVGLTTLLRNYRVSLSDKQILPISLDTKSTITNVKDGVWLNIEKI